MHNLPTGCGDGGAATSGSLNCPNSVFVDAAENLVIADFGTNRIRLVSPGTTPDDLDLRRQGDQGGKADRRQPRFFPSLFP